MDPQDRDQEQQKPNEPSRRGESRKPSPKRQDGSQADPGGRRQSGSDQGNRKPETDDMARKMGEGQSDEELGKNKR